MWSHPDTDKVFNCIVVGIGSFLIGAGTDSWLIGLGVFFVAFVLLPGD